jgi:hypothetical protein
MYFTKRLMLAAAGLGCALALTNVAQVRAASPNSRLKGAYAVSIEGNCIYAPGGLNSSDQPENPAKSFLRLLHFQGVETFDGTGKLSGKLAGLNIDGTSAELHSPGAGSFQFSVEGTYQVGPHGEVTFASQGTGTVLTGPLAGEAFSATYPSWSGYISGDNKTFLLGTNGTVASTLTPSKGEALARICSFNQAGMRM